MLKALSQHHEQRQRRDGAQSRLHARRRRLIRRQVALEAAKVQGNKHKNACAELVQALFRGIVARNYAAHLRRLRDAAVKIQLMARSRAARKEFKRLLRIKYRVVPTKYGLKHLLDRSVRERAEDGWSEWRDPATGQLFYVEMATGESQWAPPDVFAPTMVCEWQGCRLRFATANQLQDHQLVEHHWVCFACREDNAISTYPMCPKCGNQLDEEGRTMLEMKKDKAREEELVRLAQRRKDMLAAHRARQVASVPSGADVERLKSKAWARRSKSRGEGTARGISPRDGEHGLGTRPGSSFRLATPHRPPTQHGSSHRSLKRAPSGRGGGRGVGPELRTHTAPAASAADSDGAGSSGAGAGAGAGSGAGAGAQGPGAVVVVESAGLLDWGDDARLFAAAERDVAAHVPSSLRGPQLPAALQEGGTAGPDGDAGGSADTASAGRPSPLEGGSPDTARTAPDDGERLPSPARSVRFRVVTPSCDDDHLDDADVEQQHQQQQRAQSGGTGSGTSSPRATRKAAAAAAVRMGGGASPLHRQLLGARDLRGGDGPAAPPHPGRSTSPDQQAVQLQQRRVGSRRPETGDGDDDAHGTGNSYARRDGSAGGSTAAGPSSRASQLRSAGAVADGSMPVSLVNVSRLRRLPPVRRLNAAIALQPVATGQVQAAQQRWRKAMDAGDFGEARALQQEVKAEEEVQQELEGVVYMARKELRQAAAQAVESYKSLIRNGRSMRAFQGGAVFDGFVKEGLPNGKGTMTYPDGSRYRGQWVDGLRHGVGTFDGANGRKYMGQWAFGKRHGQGQLIYPSGEVYEGEFFEGFRHGRGVLTSPNGDVYSGEWERNVYHGRATFKKLNGHRFIGHAVRGVVQGPGVMVTTEGETYKGEWKDNRRHGRGTCTFPDGSVYTGKWQRGAFHGVGRLKLVNGDEYLGEWEFGERSGHGVFRMAASGDIYAGQWKAGKAAGKGTYYYAATGNRYKGMFRGSQKHGLGEYVNWKKGRYIGNWFQGHIHGRGVFYWFASGDQYRGMWAMGKKHGKGTYIWASGNVYVGQWANDQVHGRGKFTSKVRGHCYDGEWVNNVKEGHGKMLYADGNIYEGMWKEDQRHGRGTFTWNPGKLIQERYTGDFLFGKRHGYGRYEYHDGEVYEGVWVDGRRHGPGRVDAKDGTWYEGDFFLDRRHGRGKALDARGLVYDGDWNNDEWHGQGVLRELDGSVYHGEFWRGKKHGSGKVVLVNGNEFHGVWKHNFRVGHGTFKIRRDKEPHGKMVSVLTFGF